MCQVGRVLGCNAADLTGSVSTWYWLRHYHNCGISNALLVLNWHVEVGELAFSGKMVCQMKSSCHWHNHNNNNNALYTHVSRRRSARRYTRDHWSVAVFDTLQWSRVYNTLRRPYRYAVDKLCKKCHFYPSIWRPLNCHQQWRNQHNAQLYHHANFDPDECYRRPSPRYL